MEDKNLNITEPEQAEAAAAQENETPQAENNGDVQTDTGTQAETATETEAEAEVKAAPQAQEAKKSRRKNPFAGNKFKRGGMATIMSAIFIAIILVINVVVSALSERFPSMNIDMTAQKLNTLSEQAEEIARSIEEETTIYLIGSEDAYRKDMLYTSYGLEYSQVANLADKLREVNSKIVTKFIDPDTNPDFISQYSGDNLNSGKVMVSTSKRHKVLEVTDMFALTQNSSGTGYDSYSKVDSALAAALEVVNMDKVPIVAIATGHEEMLSTGNLSAFTSALEAENFQVQEVNIMTEELPEDTQVVMIPTPTTDYTEEELNKLRAFLNDETREESVTVIATFHPTQGQLPKLAEFLEEWGVAVQPGIVVETDSSRVASNSSYVLADVSEEILADGSYNFLVVPSSSPLEMVFYTNNDITTYPLWTTADTAYVLTEDTTEEAAANPDTAQQTLASLSRKLVQFGNDIYTRNVIVFGSSVCFTDTVLGTNAFSDLAYITDLLKESTDTDGSAVSVIEQSVQTNTLDITATSSTITFLGLGVFTIGLPLLILIAGMVIFLKRRHL